MFKKTLLLYTEAGPGILLPGFLIAIAVVGMGLSIKEFAAQRLRTAKIGLLVSTLLGVIGAVAVSPEREALNGGRLVESNFFDFDWDSNLLSAGGQSIFALNLVVSLLLAVTSARIFGITTTCVISLASFSLMEALQWAFARGVPDFMDLLARGMGLSLGLALFSLASLGRQKLVAPS